MQMTHDELPKHSLLTALLGFSEALGTLKEGHRAHEVRLTAVEKTISRISTPLPPSATAATGTTMKTAARQYGRTALRWVIGRLVTWLIPYTMPVLLFIGALAWKWTGVLWRFLVG